MDQSKEAPTLSGWARFMRSANALADAMEATPTTYLEARVARLERQLAALELHAETAATPKRKER